MASINLSYIQIKILGTPRIKPGVAGREARTLPLCYAPPPPPPFLSYSRDLNPGPKPMRNVSAKGAAAKIYSCVRIKNRFCFTARDRIDSLINVTITEPSRPKNRRLFVLLQPICCQGGVNEAITLKPNFFEANCSGLLRRRGNRN